MMTSVRDVVRKELMKSRQLDQKNMNTPWTKTYLDINNGWKK